MKYNIICTIKTFSLDNNNMILNTLYALNTFGVQGYTHIIIIIYMGVHCSMENCICMGPGYRI